MAGISPPLLWGNGQIQQSPNGIAKEKKFFYKNLIIHNCLALKKEESLQKKHKDTRRHFSTSLQPASCKPCTRVWGWSKNNISSIGHAEWLLWMGRAQISQRLRKMVHIPIIILSSGKRKRGRFPSTHPLYLLTKHHVLLCGIYVFFPPLKTVEQRHAWEASKISPTRRFQPSREMGVWVCLGAFPPPLQFCRFGWHEPVSL